MHVQFEVTQEEIIDTSRRFLARSEAVRSWRFKGLLYTMGLSCSLIFLTFFLLQKPLGGASLGGLLAAIISGFLYPGSHRRGVEKRLRQIHREYHGDAGSFVCEVELTPVGVWVRQMNLQITHEWESVKEIEETADSVDIITQTGGVVVRNRAFASDEERRKFIELAQGYIELTGVNDPDRDAQLTDSSI